MREIKFRAWDDIEKRWYGHSEICNKLVFRQDGWVGFLVEQIILMQYTGLNDKNGVEIYEGDIVKTWQVAQNSPLQVFYEDGCWLISRSGNKPSYSLADYEHFEVIGNIHENPELLK